MIRVVGENFQSVKVGQELLAHCEDYHRRNPPFKATVLGIDTKARCESGCRFKILIRGLEKWFDAGWFYFEYEPIQILSAENSEQYVTGIFAHGELKATLGFDMLDIPGWDGTLGIHPCLYKDEACTLWVWHTEMKKFRVGPARRIYRGLVTLDSDKEAKIGAKECYESKKERKWW
jgi:hypothetical protein